METFEKSTCFITEQNGDQRYNFHKKIRLLIFSNFTSILLILSACLILPVSFFNIYPGIIKYSPSGNQQHPQTETEFFIRPNITREKCDLFKGQWILDERGSMYTNNSCKTIPGDRNCLQYGRKDREFLNYRWKPDECELPRFDPREFLDIVQGKTMAFIGDSLARNQMDSLLCLLSLAETPTLVYKDDEERVATWKFAKHNFILRVLWAKYLVAHIEQTLEDDKMRSFDLHLDKLDTSWVEVLPSLDYVIINNGLWYFLHNHLYENRSLIGCTYCGIPNVTEVGPDVAMRKAFRTVFKGMNNCKKCRNLHILAVTHNPWHFEHGSWETGGMCNRTKPFRSDEVPNWGDLYFRDILMEEIATARNEGKLGNKTVSFDIMDITGMMMVRPDGHPNENHEKYLLEGGKRDCLHWCLPGPIDTWNELMLEMIIRSSM